MDYIYIWVKNIVIYGILVNVLTSMVNSENYKKYIRIFTGMVMVIIVITPLTKLFHIDKTFGYYFESFNYEIDTREPGIDFGVVEDSRNQMIIEGYKGELRNQITEVINNAGFNVISLEVSIIEDTMSTEYGHISQINMEIAKDSFSKKISINKVEKVVISSDERSEEDDKTDDKESTDEINIKNILSDFYNISENNINISIQE